MKITEAPESAEPLRSERVTEAFGPTSSSAESVDLPSIGDRYRIEAELGRGGMSEVLLVHDRQLDRSVALKRVPHSLADDARSVARADLLREARLQAQIDHPAFVPVYEYGVSADGTAFFTMARVNGETLGTVLARMRSEAPSNRATTRLLRSFSQLCRAIEAAHSAGFVHGDLKPSNVMLGAHGQVYVLDLGMAAPVNAEAARDVTVPRARTRGGTLAYGAPEQFGSSDPDVRWDLYALGAILFEILSLTPLHSLRIGSEDIFEWYARAERSPRARFPELDVAPELDRICSSALELDARRRTTDVRTLAAAIDDYLDGLRDHEERRLIADACVKEAIDAHRRALAGRKSSVEDFRRAVSLLGQALALVPAHEEASAAMRDAMRRMPMNVSRDVHSELESWTHGYLRAGVRAASFVYCGWFLCLIVMCAMGMRESASRLIAIGLVTIGTWAWISRRPEIRAVHMLAAVSLTSLTLCSSYRWLGPFGLTSIAFVANSVAYGMFPTRIVRNGAFGLAAFGMLASAWIDRSSASHALVQIANDEIRIRAGLTHFPPELTWWVMTVGPVLVGLSGFRVVATSVRDVIEATQQIYRDRWLLAAFAPPSRARNDDGETSDRTSAEALHAR